MGGGSAWDGGDYALCSPCTAPGAAGADPGLFGPIHGVLQGFRPGPQLQGSRLGSGRRRVWGGQSRVRGFPGPGPGSPVEQTWHRNRRKKRSSRDSRETTENKNSHWQVNVLQAPLTSTKLLQIQLRVQTLVLERQQEQEELSAGTGLTGRIKES